MALVRLTGVTKAYGGAVALRPTALDIREGEFFTLLGPSGSGKTTLLRILGGFVAPDAGRVEIGGRDVTGVPPHRRNLGVVFQSYALFPHMTVAENVAFGLRMRAVSGRAARDRAAAALEMVGLDGFGSRFPAQLSGGQQQRVALARALVIEPDVLLLDEPLGALDLALRKRMQEELRDLHRRLRRTFVYVTHDQDEALTLSDRIAVLAQGSVLQVDAPRVLYDRPASAFVAGFLGDSNLLRLEPGPRLSDGTALPMAAPAPGPHVLALRPEHLHPEVAHPGPVPAGSAPPEAVPAKAAPAAGAVVRLSATVREVVFRGPYLTLRATLASGEGIEARLPPGAPDCAPGAAITLAFAPARAAIVPAAADAAP